ncbi:hypothetical protein [Ensifer sp. BR816]|uniref:hypothetical protein n=1 Tax=Rhizobium sp. (strain BR816) TaxID=1057002 RepID=UPI00037A2867|nr:hypothetical protein [Ensifer sp. BR816]
MNFDTLEFEEIAAKLRRDGWAIKYIWSGECAAFKSWLSEKHGIAATDVNGGYSFWVVDHSWAPPSGARSDYDAWYSFGYELELDPELTPDRIGFRRVRTKRRS